MNEPKWTPAQQDAIYARGGAALVSAAAGSGKTAVLVERVVQRITADDSPCDVDRLLVVTFTNAAAAEMRERIGQSLEKKIQENPFDGRLQREKLRLSNAKICTIDSFCKGLVQEHFHELGIQQDFQILDSGKGELLRAQAAQETMEALYAAGDPAFFDLVELVSGMRDDQMLIHMIQTIYETMMAHPFPETWLASLQGMYRQADPVEQSPWGQVLLQFARCALRYSARCLTMGADLLAEEEALAKSAEPLFRREAEAFFALAEELPALKWDAVLDRLESITFDRMATPRGYGEDERKLRAVQARKQAKSQVAELLKLFCARQAEQEEDLALLSPLIGRLVSCVSAYKEHLDSLKASGNQWDFSDIEHFALRLLVREEADGWQPTGLACSLRRRFEEILVDEYQDTNRAQDILFSSLSRNEENLFFVGDVKQSIYRFRQAMPQLFMARREALEPYRPDRGGRIVLDRNFRSRSSVCQMVNFVFTLLMSKQVGELDYNREEALVPQAEYPPQGEDGVEFHLVEQGEQSDMDEAEAGYLARKIKELVARKETVTVRGVTRPVAYGDICILLRSANAHIPAYLKVLERAGIPARAAASSSLFETPEAQTVLSLLRVLDNPLQDIPLLALLLSPIYGFTPDELAQIRIPERKAPIYTALCRGAKEGMEKAAAFLEQLEQMRTDCVTLPCGALLQRLYERTGYPSVTQAMPGPEQRRANLNLFIELAQDYERGSSRGFSSFVRYLDGLEANRNSFGGAAVPAGNDCVQLMSIHRSKGLEFPVVILAGNGRKFNAQGLYERLLIHPELGLGLKGRNVKERYEYETIPHQAVKLALKQAERSEALRVLYVAMTRAREKLWMVMTVPDREKALVSAADRLMVENGKLDPYSVMLAGSDGDWLLQCALMHPDGGTLWKEMGRRRPVPPHPAECALRCVLGQAEEPPAEEGREEPALPDEALLKELEERLSYEYPYCALTQVAAKQAASQIEEDGLNLDFFAASRPAFLNTRGLTPAQRGTAQHQFMQFCDYIRAGKDPGGEVARLVQEGFLSPEQGEVIDRQAVKRFFSSPLASRMLHSGNFMREYSFSIRLPAVQCNPDLGEAFAGEQVMVQGIADCVFEEEGGLVLVDYKTDRVKDGEELKRRYAGQMEIYRQALEMTLEKPVREIYLYSFHLNQTVQYQ